ncbi:MAG: hypothetical protein WCC97_18665 [Candidatus Acidiferrales bacterium]
MENNHEGRENITQTGDQPYVFISGAQQTQTSDSEPISDSHSNHKHRKLTKFGDLNLQDRCMILLTFGILLVAAVTAIILSSQFNTMSEQTQILGTQAEGDAVSGAFSAVQIQKQLSIAQKQAQAAQDSVQAIQRQMTQDQRAWITTTLGQWHISQDNTTKEAVVYVPITVTNTGKTPAKHIFTAAAVEYVQNGKAPTFSYDVPGRTNAVAVLFPTNHSDFDGELLRAISPTETDIRKLSEEEYKAINRGAAYLAIYGQVSYLDVFKVRHWVKFCSFSNPPPGTTLTARGCTNYNDIDNR